MSIDLEKAGIVNSDGQSENSLPPEMMSEEFLSSPIGMIMQALAGLEVAAKAFDARLSQMEQYLTYLLSKDPQMGPKIAELAKQTQKENKDGQHD